MTRHRITWLETLDVRFQLEQGAGSDAVHSGAEYAFATTLLRSDSRSFGTCIVLTLGTENRIVCEVIELLGKELVGRGIEELMTQFWNVSQKLSQHPQLRWLGAPERGRSCGARVFDKRMLRLVGKGPWSAVWRMLLDLQSKKVVALLDLSYLEDVLSPMRPRPCFASCRARGSH